MLEIQVSSFTNTSIFKYLSIIYHQLRSIIYLPILIKNGKLGGEGVKRWEREQVTPSSKRRSWLWCLGRHNCRRHCRASWGGSPSLGLQTAWPRPRRCGVWPRPKAVSVAPCRSRRNLSFWSPSLRPLLHFASPELSPVHSPPWPFEPSRVLLSKSSPVDIFAELGGVTRPRGNGQTKRSPEWLARWAKVPGPSGYFSSGRIWSCRLETSGQKPLGWSSFLYILVLKGGAKKNRTFGGLMIVALAGSLTPFPYMRAEELGLEGRSKLSGLWALRLATTWFRSHKCLNGISRWEDSGASSGGCWC